MYVSDHINLEEEQVIDMFVFQGIVN